MSDRTLWKLSEETKKVLQEIKVEVSLIEKDIIDGTLLTHTDGQVLAREYAFNLGKLEGLKYLIDKVSISEEE
jgi:hypothetical protein